MWGCCRRKALKWRLIAFKSNMKIYLFYILLVFNLTLSRYNSLSPPRNFKTDKKSSYTSCIHKYFGWDSTDRTRDTLDTLFAKSANEIGVSNCPRCILLQFFAEGYNTQQDWYFFTPGADNSTLYFKVDLDNHLTNIYRLKSSYDKILTLFKSYASTEKSSEWPYEGYSLIVCSEDSKTSLDLKNEDSILSQLNEILKNHY